MVAFGNILPVGHVLEGLGVETVCPTEGGEGAVLNGGDGDIHLSHTGKSFAPNFDQTLVLSCFIVHCNLVDDFFIQLRKATDRRESAHPQNRRGRHVQGLP